MLLLYSFTLLAFKDNATKHSTHWTQSNTDLLFSLPSTGHTNGPYNLIHFIKYSTFKHLSTYGYCYSE